jgi:hypothetical protein
MKFAFHSAFDILGHMPSTVISRTELSCWRNSCSYQAMFLLGWNPRYKTSTVVFTIWLTATKYPYYKWQWIFSHIFFTFLSQRHHTRNTNCLSLASTWVPSRLLMRSMLLIGLAFCVMLCFSVLFVFVLCHSSTFICWNQCNIVVTMYQRNTNSTQYFNTTTILCFYTYEVYRNK